MNTPYLSPYLNFNGNCGEAMTFYQSVLGGKLQMQTFAEAKMDVPENYKSKIVHATLQNDSLSFMASDGMPGNPIAFGDNIHMSIAGTDEKLITGFFNGLSRDGKVDMPLASQFWGDTFGMLTDKFGVHWMVNIGSGQKT